jgi:DNA-binding SARP family transcriptional activator
LLTPSALVFGRLPLIETARSVFDRQIDCKTVQSAESHFAVAMVNAQIGSVLSGRGRLSISAFELATLMTLELALLGRPRVVLDGRDLTTQIGDKPLAVLVYLALETPPPIAREKLAGVFWQDKTDDAARYRLRNTLWNLRRDFGQEYIGADDFNCWINQSIQVDALTLRASIKTAKAQAPAAHSLPELAALAALYRGDFLEGISVREAPMFEEWLLVERERLLLIYQNVLWLLAQTQQTAGANMEAVHSLTRLIQIDPLRERSYRALMNIHAQAGDRTAALRVYEQCVHTLATELSLEPSIETKRLREQIAQGKSNTLQAELEQRLVQAEAALADGRPEHARTLIQSARQAIQNLFR